MKHIPVIWRLLRISVCWITTACNAQNSAEVDTKASTWHPDAAILSKTNIVWGLETNHIKAGLNIQSASDSTGRTLIGFFVVLYNNSDTNGNYEPDLLSLILPPINSRYKMALFDEKGNAVLKTKIGKANDQPFDINPKRLDRDHGYGLRDISPFVVDIMPFDPVVLEDYFAITNAGKYHLKFVLNVLKGTDQYIQPYYLPVDADIDIEKP